MINLGNSIILEPDRSPFRCAIAEQTTILFPLYLAGIGFALRALDGDYRRIKMELYYYQSYGLIYEK